MARLRPIEEMMGLRLAEQTARLRRQALTIKARAIAS
jgi:hypothetical protein